MLHFDQTTDEETIMELALESGAEDVESDEAGNSVVFTTFETFSEVLAAFRESDCAPLHAETTMWPSTTTACDVALTEKTLSLVDALEELDDVQRVYTNAELSDLPQD